MEVASRDIRAVRVLVKIMDRVRQRSGSRVRSWVPQTMVLFTALRGTARASAETVAVSPTSEAEPAGGDAMDDDALDLAAFEAMRDDDLQSANAVFNEMLLRDSDDTFAAMWLGMIAVRRWDLKVAEMAFAHAVATIDRRMWVEDAREAYSLEAKRAGLELSLSRVRERLAAAADGGSDDEAASAERLRPTPIRRVAFHDLSPEEFVRRHADAREPVIITGFDSLADADAPTWSLEHLRATCGHLPARVVQYNERSATWAGMHKAADAPATFALYLDALARGESARVVFGWGLRLEGGCRALLETFRVPSYFSDTIVAGYGPELFVQPNGTRCGLHFDTGATHFWQYVWQGAKRWRVFRAEDWPRLFPPLMWQRAFFRDARCTGLFGAAAAAAAHCDDGFGAVLVDGFDDDGLARLMARGPPLAFWEGTLRARELLFVPSRMPHQVVNVGGGVAVAVSMNYVDRTNLAERRRWHLENTELHDKFRARLNKSGRVVPGSQTRWFERFRMPIESSELRRVHAAALHVEAQPARPAAAFLEPWGSLVQRPWNLRLVEAGA